MKPTRLRIIILAAFLIIIWVISAWFIANKYYLARKSGIVEKQTKLSQDRANDLADSIHRNLNFIAGIPYLVSQTTRVQKTISLFKTNETPSSIPLEVRKKRWSENQILKSLSLYLRQVQGDLHIDLIYVVDKAGDCIAAGNINTDGSSIGTNYAERNFFHANKNNKPGMQYAVGKTTHIPGLFFSYPIFINGRFMGAVVVKNDVPNLTSLITQVSAFVTDSNGVIILAQNKRREMLSLPAARIAGIPMNERMDRYRKLDFPTMPIESWGDEKLSSLMRVQNSASPHILISQEIADYGMKVYIDTAVDEILTLDRDESWFAFLLGMLGSVLIFIAGGTFLFVESIKAKQIALIRAGIAERKIITVSEETMRKIGRELHDDLGQHLTGIAFRASMLFHDLKEQGLPESENALIITTLIDEAINKTRKLAQGLYPIELQHGGLPALLEQLAAKVSSSSSMECEFILNGECNISDQLVLINLFRIAQEAVNNALKHSSAERITLTMEVNLSGMTLEIADNGIGLGKKKTIDEIKGFGMHTMFYRASLLGASFCIADQTAGGTRVTITIPST